METQQPFGAQVVRFPRSGVPCLQLRRALLLQCEAAVARGEALDLPPALRVEHAAVADMVDSLVAGDANAALEAALHWRAARIARRQPAGEGA